MVDDIYDILSAMSAVPEGRDAICLQQTTSALCKAIAGHCYRMSTGFNVINLLIYDY